MSKNSQPYKTNQCLLDDVNEEISQNRKKNTVYERRQVLSMNIYCCLYREEKVQD